MKWLPYENFYLITDLKPDAAEAALAPDVIPDAGFGLKTILSRRTEGYFTGVVANGSFKIRWQIYYRNSFLPRITGDITPYLNGSRIHIKMKPHIAVMIFMSIWMGGVGLAGIAFVLGHPGEGLNAGKLAPFGMFLFGYLLSIGAFKFESIKAKSKLAEIFRGSIEEI
jgi:hypothetical protein